MTLSPPVVWRLNIPSWPPGSKPVRGTTISDNQHSPPRLSLSVSFCLCLSPLSPCGLGQEGVGWGRGSELSCRLAVPRLQRSRAVGAVAVILWEHKICTRTKLGQWFCDAERPGGAGKLTFLTSYLMASLIRLRLGRWWSDKTWKFTSPFKIASTSSVSRHRSSTPTTKSLHCIDNFL